ncbi:MAG: tetratricopeptide repeat protein [Nitrospirae bacterium]|nr:tetratricopeptide repeat protein [Nitrospirota bacterium]
MNWYWRRAIVVGWVLIAMIPAPGWGRSAGQDALEEGTRWYQSGEFEKALSAFKQATDLDPGLLRAWKNMGYAYRKLHQDDQAIRVWDTLLKIDPGQFRLLNEMGSIAMTRQAWDLAAPRFAESLRLKPNQPAIRLQLGEAYEALGRAPEAVREYRAVLDSPFALSATLRLMALYEKAGQEDQAIQLLEERVRQAANPVRLRAQLARLSAKQGRRAYQAGDFQRAETAYRVAVTWDASHVQYWVDLGWAQRKQGQVRSALDTWLKALALDPGATQLYRHLGDGYLELEELPEAQTWYERAWGVQPQPEVSQSLARIALQQERDDAAVQWATRTLEVSRGAEDWYRRIAHLFIQYDREARGAVLFRERLSIAREVKPAHDALSQLYAAQAGAAFRHGDFDGAIGRYDLALEMEPTNPQALRDLGWVYWKAERWDRCEATWKRFAAAYPDQPEPDNLLTRLYLFRKAYPAAIETATASLKLSPEQPEEKLKLAKALFWDGRFETAYEQARSLSERYPAHLPIQFFWGELLMQAQDFQHGKDQWRRVLDLGSDSPRARVYWLRSMYEAGDYAGALRFAREAVARGPDAQLTRFLADDAVRVEDYPEAARWYEKLVRDFPERPAFALELSRLDQQMGWLDRSRDVLERARAQHPDHQEILLSLAEANRLVGRYDEAYRQYVDLIARYPEQRRAFAGLLQTMVEAKRYPEALALLDKDGARFLKPYDAELLRAHILTETGRTADAERRLTQMVAENDETHDIPILLYHGLGAHPRSESLPVELFDSQLQALRDAGYTTITVRELGPMLEGKHAFPPKPILITFDDARIDSFRLGDPVLARYGMTATMFVPTGKIVRHGPFFADWETMRAYADTRRWDFQSHGHHAHDLIAIDQAGQVGGFLTNRLWLEEDQRSERPEEFAERVEADYWDSLSILRRNLPGLDVIGYAFPFGEAGQENFGNEPTASTLNERLSQTYFRFTFVQDQDGYNRVGRSSGSLLLHRFSVPRAWDGKRLLDHLAARRPANTVSVALGKSYYVAGEYQKARVVFQQLASHDEPRLHRQAEHDLAAVSYQQGRYREAQRHLAASLGPDQPVVGDQQTLLRKIMWENRPSASARSGRSQDSDHRSAWWWQTPFRYPFTGPLDLELALGEIHLGERGRRGLMGRELTVGSRWDGLLDHIALEGRFRRRWWDGAADTANAWLKGTYRSDRHELKLAWSYEDVDTVLAREADLQVRGYGADYVMRPAPLWRGQVNLAYGKYDDGNARIDVRSSLAYRLGALSDWQVGGGISGSDTRFRSPRYYTPDQLRFSRGTLTYLHRGESGWSFEGQAGLGLAQDVLHGTRWTRSGLIEGEQAWTARLRTRLRGEYSSEPGYSSWVGEAELQYRF